MTKKEILSDIVENTILVLSTHTENKEEWSREVLSLKEIIESNGDVHFSDFLGAIISLLQNGKPEQIQSVFHPVYQKWWDKIVMGIQDSDKDPKQHIVNSILFLLEVRSEIELKQRIQSTASILLKGDKEDVVSAFKDIIDSEHDKELKSKLEEIKEIVLRCRKLGIDAAILSLKFPTDKNNVSGSLRELLNLIFDKNNNVTTSQRIAFCTEALKQFNRENDPDLWAAIHTVMGRNLLKIDIDVGNRTENIERAIEHFNFALEIHEKETFLYRWPYLINDLGSAYAQRYLGEKADNIEKAILLFEQALTESLKETDPDLWGMICGNLALAYSERKKGVDSKNLDLATDYGNMAFEVITKESYPEKWAQLHHNLGTIYTKRAERRYELRSMYIEGAMKNFELSLEVRTIDHYPYEWATTNLNLCTLYSRRVNGNREENIEKAIDLSHEVEKVLSKTAHPYDWATLRCNLGKYYVERIRGDRTDNINHGVECILSALSIYDFERRPYDYYKTIQSLAELYFDCDEWAKAIPYFDKVLELNEILLNSAYTEFGRKSEISESSRSFFEAAYCCCKTNNFQKAFELAEKGRARLLSQSLLFNDLDLSLLPFQYRDKVGFLRKKIKELETELRIRTDIGEDYFDISTRLATNRKDLRNLINEIQEVVPSFMQSDFDLSDLLMVVPENSAVAMFLITIKGTYVFLLPHGTMVIKEENVVEYPDFTFENINKLLFGKYGEKLGWWGVNARFRFATSFKEINKAQDEIKRFIFTSTKYLWTELLGKIDTKLAKWGIKNVILCPQGGLQLLPLHSAWKYKDKKPIYFADKYEISYTYSLITLKHCVERAKSRKSYKALILGVEEYLNYPRLRNAHLEAAAIAKILNSSSVIGSDVNLTMVHDRSIDCGYFHFACHGFYDWEGDALDSGLILSNDEILKLSMVIHGLIDLSQSRLVTLSACETGIPDIKSTLDEYIGLSAGFLEAGAPTVLASLWGVDDDSTSLLMGEFYKNLIVSKKSISASLKNAQTWLRENHPKYSHPYFWAAFCVVGAFEIY